MQKGYWNGEKTADIKVVLYKVGPAETPTWWVNRVVGSERQGVLITYRGETWLIDNEHGDGYFKVTDGFGSPRVGHKSVASYEIIRELAVDEWKVFVTYEAMADENAEHDKWLEANHPEAFQKSQALKAALKAHQEKYPNIRL